MYSEKISDFIDKHKGEMKDKLVRLMEIPSVKSEAKPGMPYGENVHKAFAELLCIADGMGFNADNFENRVACVTVDDKEKNLGILCHLDVVEAGGSGWSAPPFRPTVKENIIYGRGAYDNKGPAIAALYALYAVRELGIPLNFGAALYFGTDEECGSSDFEEYLKKHTLPKHVFVPDSHFPVCNEERGIIHMSADGKVKPKKVVSAHAGSQINIIPDEAEVCFENVDSDEIDGILSSMKGIRYEIREEGQSALVKIHGKSTHASRPDTGVNAVTAMLKLLGYIEKGTFEKLADLFRFGAFYGEGFCFEEGRLTLSLTSLDYENGNLAVKTDSRVVYDSAGAAERIAEIIPMNVNIIRLDEPHNVPEESYIVKTLSDIYKEHTGKDEKPYSMAGLTYAHDIEGAVVFGSVFPGDGSGYAHGADERFNLDSMAEAAKIFAKAIVRICNEE